MNDLEKQFREMLEKEISSTVDDRTNEEKMIDSLDFFQDEYPSYIVGVDETELKEFKDKIAARRSQAVADSFKYIDCVSLDEKLRGLKYPDRVYILPTVFARTDLLTDHDIALIEFITAKPVTLWKMLSDAGSIRSDSLAGQIASQRNTNTNSLTLWDKIKRFFGFDA